MSATSRARRVPATDSSDGEFLWLVSLSDLMILLFSLFVVLFSVSYRKLSSDDLRDLTSAITGRRAPAQLDEIQSRLLKWVADRDLLSKLTLQRKQDALVFEIKEKLLFEKGSSFVREDSLEVLAAMGEALRMIPPPFRIGVEGHTDNQRIEAAALLGAARARGEVARDNWELSTRRALSVLEALDLGDELEARTTVSGHADTQPLVPNETSEGEAIAANQALNRRVTVRIY